MEENKMNEYTLKDYWKFVNPTNKIHGCNYKFKTETYTGFCKNHFVKTFQEFEQFTRVNRDKDCYVTYNHLKTSENRKNENVLGLNMISLDIEYEFKQKPEQKERLQLMLHYVKVFLHSFEVKSYLIVMSGNGIHLYMPIGDIVKRDIEILKPAYNRFVKQLSFFLEKISDNLLKSDDRKDLAGILRIPFTTNTSAGRKVTIEKIETNGDNVRLRKMFMSTLRKTKGQLAKQKERIAKINLDDYEVEVPETMEELEAHPITQMFFDTDLPDIEGWHSTIGFALQSIVKHSGIPYYPDIQLLERDINSFWQSSLSLQHCNADNAWGPLKGAYNFCKANKGFEKYAESLGRILK